MPRSLLPALALLALLALAACGGRTKAQPTAPMPDSPAKPEPAAATSTRAPTLADRLSAAAPGDRPAQPAYERVLPGMAADDIAKLLGRPDHVRERGENATLRWRTGGPHDPDFIVWLRQGVADRMRFADRW